jgi:hypothetical protein
MKQHFRKIEQIRITRENNKEEGMQREKHQGERKS